MGRTSFGRMQLEFVGSAMAVVAKMDVELACVFQMFTHALGWHGTPSIKHANQCSVVNSLDAEIPGCAKLIENLKRWVTNVYVNVFLPSISWCISRWTFCTRVDRQRSPHPGSALWVSSASGVRCFGARKCRWSRMFSLSYDTENGEDKKNKFDLLDKMTVMFYSPISSSSSDTSGVGCLKMEICTMWRTSFFSRLHTMCAVRSLRESTRGRTVQGGLDVPFCFGRTLLVSGLIPEAFMSRTWQCRYCCPSYHDGGKTKDEGQKKCQE